MKTLLPISFLLCFGQILLSQPGNFTGKLQPAKALPNLQSSVEKFQVFEIPASSLDNYLKSESSAGELRLQLGGSFDWIIELEEYDLRSPGYKLRVAGSQGITEYANRPGITYRGRVKGNNGGEVRLTIRKDFIYGCLKANGEEYFIEPARKFDKTAGKEEFVVYAKSDIIPQDLGCGVDHDNIEQKDFQPPAKGPGSGSPEMMACKDVELACAADHLMFNKYFSDPDEVEAYAFGVMNNVNGDYSSAFNDVVNFVFVEFFISTTSGTDPVATSILDASTVLCNFKNWGNAGGFTSSHDLGQFWTNRDFDGTTIGIAYVDVICFSGTASGCSGSGYLGYHALQDFNATNACQTRVLVSHEIGHNFDADHDASGSGFIMAPSVTCTSSWSAASITSINGVLGRSCLESCTTVYGVPDANFLANTKIACRNVAVSLQDLSTNEPTSWSWTFTGGSPGSSSSQSPSVTYSTNGAYTVALTATNSMGGDTETKAAYINVVNPPASTATPDDASAGTLGITAARIDAFKMLNFSGGTAAAGSYEDFTCSVVTELATNTSYSFYATVGNCSGPSYEGVRVWIDYNGDGDFNDAGEDIGNTAPFIYCGVIPPITINTPATPATNQVLRMRVISEVNAIPSSPNLDPVQGQVEDYGIYFAGALPVELIHFTGKPDGKNVQLSWRTASEINNDYFTLERSPDGLRFESIGTVPGAGTSAVPQDYSFFDKNPFIGINYYRLKQTDFDGNFRYSKIVTVAMEKAEGAFSVYPSPLKGDVLTLSFEVKNPGAMKVELYSVDGKLVKTEEYLPEARQQILTLNVQGLSAGMYLVKMTHGGAVSAVRFFRE